MNLDSFLRPNSIAVIGASKDPNKVGSRLLTNLESGGFKGLLLAVNPKAEVSAGASVVRSIKDSPVPIDLAFIAVPAAALSAVVAECISSKVKGLVIITSGLAETGDEGRKVEEELIKNLKSRGIRTLGPNCFGFANTDPEVCLNGTFGNRAVLPGNVALLSESGAVGIVLLEYAESAGIGFSLFVSLGNRADLSSNDFLSFLGQDPRTDVIALYLESFGNPKNFARIARAVARSKPIVAVKAGRSESGYRAALSHSAALMALDVAVDAVCEQAGVIRVDTFHELVNVVRYLATQPARGSEVAVITNAGGPGILFTDFAERNGVKLAEISGSAKAELKTFLPSFAGLSNPIDLTATATPQDFERTIRIVAEEPQVHSIAIIYVPVGDTPVSSYEAAIATAAQAISDKGILAVIPSSTAKPLLRTGAGSRAVPVFHFPEEGSGVFAAVSRYEDWLRLPPSEHYRLSMSEQEGVRRVIDSALARGGSPWLTWPEIAALLGVIGLRAAKGIVTAPKNAVKRAVEIGYPLVAKIISSTVIHKTDIGGVVAGISNDHELNECLDRFEKSSHINNFELEGVLLQEYFPEGIEAFVGVTHDKNFGPIIAAGIGGVAVEMTADLSFGLPPIDVLRATKMVDKLRGKKLFERFRGGALRDRAAFEQILLRISALTEVAPELVELDLNPIKVRSLGEGAIVVDARALLNGTKVITPTV